MFSSQDIESGSVSTAPLLPLRLEIGGQAGAFLRRALSGDGVGVDAGRAHGLGGRLGQIASTGLWSSAIRAMPVSVSAPSIPAISLRCAAKVETHAPALGKASASQAEGRVLGQGTGLK